MKKALWFVVLMLMISVVGVTRAQERADSTGNGDLFMSAFAVRPQLLGSGHYRIGFSSAIPKYYKAFNPMAGKITKKLPVLVINEAHFDLSAIYGWTDKLNFYVDLPFKDLHYYSPMMFREGVGPGDLDAGLLCEIWHKGTSRFLTLESRIILPTGVYLHKPQVLNTGNGALGFLLGLNGLNRYRSGWQMAYSAYLQYNVGFEKISKGPWAGAYLLLQRPYQTIYGKMGWETGMEYSMHRPDMLNGQKVPMTGLMQADLSLGGWYRFAPGFYLRMTVPWTVYQNKAFLTKYTVILQLDYLF